MTGGGRSWLAAPLLGGAFLLAGCTSLPDPLERLARELARYPEYSVVLKDMDITGSFFKSYHHRYDVLVGEPGPAAAAGGGEAAGSEGEGTGLTFTTQNRDWVEVSKTFYDRYQPMLGMVVLSKGEDGEVDQANYPPGYQYVGNPRYGSWRRDSRGGSFWEFYGQYALFSHLLGLGRQPLYHRDYDAYRTSRSQRRPYFGPGNNYGTRGTYTRTSNPSFYQRQQVRQRDSSERFAKKVRSRASSSRSRSGGRGK